MLIYSESRLVPTDVNMLTIGNETDGYYYIHRALYDQAVILEDIYGESIEILIEHITGQQESREDVDTFLMKAPSPIRIFAPFLLLVKNQLESYMDMVGAIHVMSGPVNLRKMLKVPYEMRNTPTFSLSIREEYKLAWDRFFLTTLPYSEDMFLGSSNGPMSGVATVIVSNDNDYSESESGELSNIGDDGVEYADPLEAIVFGCSPDIFDLDDDELEEIEVLEAEDTSEPEPDPEPAHEPVSNKPMSGLDALLNDIV